jgi:uncharacterized membrane protein (DUF485 family)
MDHFITPGEFALLLYVFWLPVFLIAAVLQWRLLGARRKRFAWLMVALLLECILAFVVLVSPLHRHLLSSLDFLGGMAIGSLPLQAAVFAAAVITLGIWVIARRTPRPAS